MDDVVSLIIFGFIFDSLTRKSESTFNRYLYLFSAYIKAENPFSQQYIVENPVNGILAASDIFVDTISSQSLFRWCTVRDISHQQYVLQCYVGIGIRRQTRVRQHGRVHVYAIVVFRYVEHRPAPKTAFSRIRRAAQTVDPSIGRTIEILHASYVPLREAI